MLRIQSSGVLTPARLLALAVCICFGMASTGCSNAGDSSERLGEGGGGSEEAQCTIAAECDDENACNGAEVCEAGVCGVGVPLRCDDGFECSTALNKCVDHCDQDDDGHAGVQCDGPDCDDSDPASYPGNTEFCRDAKGKLNDAALLRDEDCDPTTLGEDRDEDGFFDAACGNRDSSGRTVYGADCDDSNDLVRPGAQEICDGLDNDCVRGLDFPGEDDDGDGYADCVDLADEASFDCDDRDATINPRVDEDPCDGIDADCDGSPEDADEDGYIDLASTCEGGQEKLDCEDSPNQDGAGINPVAVETCNGVDDDCNGEVDDDDVVLRECGAANFQGHPICATDALGCDVECQEGAANCDGDLANGCEVNLQLSAEHCGACGNDSCPFGCNLGICIKAKQVFALGQSACANLETEELVCWGATYGNLPTHGPKIPGGVKELAGAAHLCALTLDGAVYCWGADSSGQVGDGNDNQAQEPLPVLISLPEQAVAIAAHHANSCALLQSGALYCWGDDLGVGDGPGNTATKYAPVQVPLDQKAVDVALGYQFGCAVVEDGDVYCWGRNSFGILGDSGALASSQSPVLVAGLTEAATSVVAHDDFVCALLDSGAVSCWGQSTQGALGDGGPDSGLRGPGRVNGPTEPALEITAGSGHACLVTESGDGHCWGRDLEGQLGNGPGGGRQSLSATPVATSQHLVHISAGIAHTCGLTKDGAVYCWGDNTSGAIGNGQVSTTEDVPTSPSRNPAQVSMVHVAAGESHSCAVRADGEVLCWGGYISWAGLGPNADEETPQPLLVAGTGGGATRVVVGLGYSCVLSDVGQVECWGDLPVASSVTPTEILGLQGRVVDLAGGAEHVCALLADGRVQCWGSQSFGGFGEGVSDQRDATDVVGLSGPVARLWTGGGRTCASLLRGGVQCWGYWSMPFGLDQGLVFEATSVQTFAETPTSLGLGAEFACWTDAGGQVVCQGEDRFGQLGNGPEATANQDAPSQVTTATQVRDVVAGTRYACARLAGYEVQCWGENSFGLSGASNVERVEQPGDVIGLAGPALQVSPGDSHACALLGDGRVQCWGWDGSEGLLGDGARNSSGSGPVFAGPFTE